MHAPAMSHEVIHYNSIPCGADAAPVASCAVWGLALGVLWMFFWILGGVCTHHACPSLAFPFCGRQLESICSHSIALTLPVCWWSHTNRWPRWKCHRSHV